MKKSPRRRFFDRMKDMTDNYIAQQKKLIQKIKTGVLRVSDRKKVAQMQSNYVDENDDRLCLTSLVFIPEDITDKISEKIIKPLKNMELAHFYYPPQSMHLTVKNIRTIHKPPLFTEEDVVKVKELFQQIIPKFKPFSFSLKGLILFPKTISLVGYCNETFGKLMQALDNGLKKIGLPDNKKYFSKSVFFGNITLCRFIHQPTKSFIDKVRELEDIYIGKIRVEKINLVICNLVCNPKTRKIIATYPLVK